MHKCKVSADTYNANILFWRLDRVQRRVFKGFLTCRRHLGRRLKTRCQHARLFSVSFRLLALWQRSRETAATINRSGSTKRRDNPRLFIARREELEPSRFRERRGGSLTRSSSPSPRTGDKVRMRRRRKFDRRMFETFLSGTNWVKLL